VGRRIVRLKHHNAPPGDTGRALMVRAKLFAWPDVTSAGPHDQKGQL
jgi:hypothetical protein